MKAFLTAVLLFSSWQVLADCNSIVGITVQAPNYSGEQSLWSALKETAATGTFVQPSDRDIKLVGTCTLNQTSLERPADAIVATAPAVLVKKGDHVFMLIGRGYSLNLPAWPTGENACLDQITKLTGDADRFAEFKVDKVQYFYKNSTYVINTINALEPVQYKLVLAGASYIVKKDTSEFCVFKK